MTRAEYDEIIALVCPHCAKGSVPKQRPDLNREWVHQGGQAQVSVTICWANGLRNSHFADEVKSG